MKSEEFSSPGVKKRASSRIRAMARDDVTNSAAADIDPPTDAADADGVCKNDDAPTEVPRGEENGGMGGESNAPGTTTTTACSSLPGGGICPPIIPTPPPSASDLAERNRLSQAYAMGGNASVAPSLGDGSIDGGGGGGESSGRGGGRRQRGPTPPQPTAPAPSSGVGCGGRGGRKKIAAPPRPRGSGDAAPSPPPPSPGYPPASELISDVVRALASRAASAEAEASGDRVAPPPSSSTTTSSHQEGMDVDTTATTNNVASNKRGRPRKDETTTTTRQRRKGAGRPRKAILPPPGTITNDKDNDAATMPQDDAMRGSAPSVRILDDVNGVVDPETNVVDDDRGVGGAYDGLHGEKQGGVVVAAGPYEPLPLKRSPSVYYDEEYARFMRSIIGDDQTVFTFATLRTTTTTLNDDVDAVDGDGTGAALTALEGDVGTVVGSHFETTLEDDDVSYHLTSDDDNGDDDDDDDDDDDVDDDDEEIEEDDGDGDDKTEVGSEEVADECDPFAPETQSSFSVEGSLPVDPPPRMGDGGENNDDGPCHLSPDGRANDEYYDEEGDDLFDKLVGEIEELMEEDLEAAAMASLIGGVSAEVACGGGGDSSVAPIRWDGGVGGGSTNRGVAVGAIDRGPSSRGPGGNAGVVMGMMQQRAITTPGASTKKKKSTTTVVTTPPPCSMGDGGRADGDDATSSGEGGAIEVPAVSIDQMARLRSIMARHHQLLLQQATLSVRAAYVQKVRKDGVSPLKVGSNATLSPTTATTTNGGRRPAQRGDCSTLPESRLDTRSLTFCSNPYAGSGCSYPNDFFGGETPEELSESLDGAVGMLQDLEQNWKDAVRNSIQLPPITALPTVDASQAHGVGGGESALSSASLSEHSNNKNTTVNKAVGITSDSLNGGNRRLTRSAFTKTLRDRELEMNNNSAGLSLDDSGSSSPAKHHQSSSSSLSMVIHATSRISVFDIRGLSRLKESFSALDNSVKDIQMGREKGKNKDGINILSPELHGQACEILLKHARAEIDMTYLPGGTPDLGECLTHAPEAFDEPNKVNHPLTRKQEAELRMNRHTFTAGEDNLILRGVNLYGEKEWCLVSDRYLPDRAVNSISQRYNKLCFLIYRANGIEIDDKGRLAPIPTFPKGVTYDVTKCMNIKPARAPTTMNVHRWTLEEDVAILKAVPIMGSLWAEICTRLMTHRDRGHIRKRYQVLQRRIPKGVTKMNMKYLKCPAEQRSKSPPKSPKRAQAMRSPAKKREIKKKITLKSAGHSRVVSSHKQPRAGTESASPAKIFQLAAQAHKQQPPVSPIKSSAPGLHMNSSNNASRALFQALETVQSERLETSPETRVVASVLGGFSQGSRLDSFRPPEYEEYSHMGVEKILCNNDDWSQASRIRRLIEAGAAESNHVRDHRLGDAEMPSYVGDELPMYQILDGEASGLSVINGNGEHADGETYQRKSILTSVLSNARKRQSDTAFPSTPTIFASPSQNSALAAPEGYPSSIPSSAISFNLNTPSKEGLDTKEELSMNQEFYEYFMSEKSRHGTEMSVASPPKTTMLMSPIKIGKLAPATPLSQYGAIESISGPLDGDNSLFDAVAALKDLSNSAPNTPSKLLRPRDGTQSPARCDQESTDPESKDDWTVSRKRPKTSFFGQVKAKMEERKTS